MKKLSTEQFIKRANDIHGNKYIYKKCVYTHSLDYVIVTCPIHGDFSIKATNHINNKQGCAKCGLKQSGEKQRTPYNKLMEDIKRLEKYIDFDFSLIPVDFKNKKQKVPIICNKHGEYRAAIRDVFRSKFCGCKKCRIDDDKHDTDIFIEQSLDKHGERYDYSLVEYKKAHDYVKIICPEHGEFNIKAYIHVAGGGFCPKCTNFVSSQEIECADFLEKNGIKFQSTVRNIPDISELDIVCEKEKIAIEFNGLYWHSNKFKTKNYHINKTRNAKEKGYRLVHIFEDEWRDKKDICKSRILNLLGSNKTIYARLCRVSKINSKTCKDFLNKNHIQGHCISAIRYGLFFENNLIAVATFCKKRLNLGYKTTTENDYELLRFCSAIGINVVGGCGKLLKTFEKEFNPKSIISYCDLRWGDGKMYEKIGFIFDKITEPNYFYIKGGKRFNRFKFRKDVLVRQGHDKSKTEMQIMSENGYGRIYDCGNKKFIKLY